MNIQVRQCSDVLILDLTGKMTLGEGDDSLVEAIDSLLERGEKKLVLNMEGVPYIDSCGLAAITRSYTTTRRAGGSLRLLHLTRRITDLLHDSKLLRVFEIFDSESEAITSFWRPARPT